MQFADVRAKYPQYDDLTDDTLARGLHQKFYSDMPFEDFAGKIGYKLPVVQSPAAFTDSEQGLAPEQQEVTSGAYVPPEPPKPDDSVQSGEEARIRTNLTGRILQAADNARTIIEGKRQAEQQRLGEPVRQTETPDLIPRAAEALNTGATPETAGNIIAGQEIAGTGPQPTPTVERSPLPGTERGFAPSAKTFLGEPRTAGMEVINQISAGGASFTKGIGSALQLFSAPGSRMHDIGKEIEENSGAGRPHNLPQPEAHNAFTNLIAQGAYMTGQFAPAMALGSLAGPAGVAAGTLPLAADMAMDTYHKAIDKGLDEETARKAGLTVGAVQLGLMTAGGTVLNKLMGGALERMIGKTAAQRLLSAYETPSALGAAAKTYGLSVADTTAMFGAMGYATAQIEKSFGVDDADPTQAGLASAKEGIALGLIMGPLGAVNAGRDAAARARIGRALVNPSASRELRLDAVREVAARLEAIDPKAAGTWEANARMAVSSGQPIELNTDWRTGRKAGQGERALSPEAATGAESSSAAAGQKIVQATPPELAEPIAASVGLPELSADIAKAKAAGVDAREVLENYGDILGRPFKPETLDLIDALSEVSTNPETAAAFRAALEKSDETSAGTEGKVVVADAGTPAERNPAPVQAGERTGSERAAAAEAPGGAREDQTQAVGEQPSRESGGATGARPAADRTTESVGEKNAPRSRQEPSDRESQYQGNAVGRQARGRQDRELPTAEPEKGAGGGGSGGVPEGGAVERRVADRGALNGVSDEALASAEKYGSKLAPIDGFARGDQVAMREAGVIKEVNGREVVDVTALVRERARRKGDRDEERQAPVDEGRRGGGGGRLGGGERDRGQRAGGDEPAGLRKEALAPEREGAQGEERGGVVEPAVPEEPIKPQRELKPKQRIKQARGQIDHEPSEAEKLAGNYDKGHLWWNGLNLSLENAKGSTRTGVSKGGKAWKSKLAHDYGYVRGTTGKDKDHIDIFMGPHPESNLVVVVDQKNPKTGAFDEHKIVAGFKTAEDAIAGYKANYPKGWKGVAETTETDVAGLRRWLDGGNHKLPASAPSQRKVFNPPPAPVGQRLVGRIKELGGIDTREASDTLGERGRVAARLMPGLFQTTERGPSGRISKGWALSTLVHDRMLNDYLPPEMRPDSDRFDVDASVDYLRDLIQRDLSNKDVGPWENRLRREMDEQALEETGYNALEPDSREAVAVVVTEDARDIPAGMTDEEVNAWFNEGAADVGEAAAGAARESERGGEETPQAKGAALEPPRSTREREPSAEYKAALEAARAAEAKYRPIVEAYRAKQIGDKEYLAARAERDAAAKAFDEAEAKEKAALDDKTAADNAVEFFTLEPSKGTVKGETPENSDKNQLPLFNTRPMSEAQRKWWNAEGIEALRSFREMLPDKELIVFHSSVSAAEAAYLKERGTPLSGAKHTLGWFDPPTGKVHVILGQHRNASDAFVTTIHETVGHYGFRALLGPDKFAQVIAAIDTARALGNPHIRRLEASVRETHPQITDILDVKKGTEFYDEGLNRIVRARFADEIISRASEFAFDEKGNFKPGFAWLKRVYSIIAGHLRSMGFDVKFTQSELEGLISRSYANLREHRTPWDTKQEERWYGGSVQVLRQERPIWHSELSRQIGELKLDKATPEQWAGTIDSLKGVKRDEIEWSGIKDWLKLQPGKVSREDVQRYLAENGVRVEEELLGGKEEVPVDVKKIGKWWAVVDLRDDSIVSGHATEEEAQQAATAHDEAGGYAEREQAKFDRYQLPGGKNYRELLLRLPHVDGPENEHGFATESFHSFMERTGLGEAEARPRYMKERKGQVKFQSDHFTQPNILAHVRFNERPDANGKKVLFIEELQSDWAQKARKQGFAIDNDTELSNIADRYQRWWREQFGNEAPSMDEITPSQHNAMTEHQRTVFHNFVNQWNRADTSRPGVPRAPFVGKTEAWVGLSLKRMIRYAAENGFDRVAWTTGEQQAQRYKLSRHVDSMAWFPLRGSGETKVVQINTEGASFRFHIQDGRITDSDHTALEGKLLDDVVGKGVAKRILEEPNGTVEGANLDVGGEGMKAFYDKIVPNVANDVLKKLGGGKVGEVEGLIKRGVSNQRFVMEGGTYGLLQAAERLDTIMADRDTDVTMRRQARDVAEAFGGHLATFQRAMEEYGSAALAEKIGGRMEQEEPLKGAQPGFDITPAMKARAMMGMPLFQRRQPGYTPYQGVAEARFEKRPLLDSLLKVVAPASPMRGEAVVLQAGIMRHNLARQARVRELALEQLKDTAKMFSKMSPAENFAFIDRMERGQAQPTPELERVAKDLRQFLDQRRAMVVSLGKGQLENFIENYFPHIYQDEDAARAYYSRRPLEGNKAFLKERTYDYLADAMRPREEGGGGLKAISDNPVELALLKAREIDRYVFGQKIFKEMKDAGLAQFVRFGKRAPEGWTKINDKIAKVYFPAESGEGLIQAGEYYAPDGAAQLINNHLSPGLQGNTAYQMFRHAGLALNSLQLGMSAFHLGFTTLDAMVSKAALGVKQVSRGSVIAGAGNLLQSVNPAQPFINLYKGDRMIRAYLNKLQDPELAPIVEAALQGGARIKMDDFYRNAAVNSFRNAVRQGQYLRAIPRGLAAGLDRLNAPIFEYLVPRQKLGVFFDLAKDWIEKHPNATLEERRAGMGKLWDSVDNRMGQLVYDNVFWNRALKDGLMVAVRSVGWNLGTIRELGGGVLDLKDIGKNKGFSDRTAYAVALPFMTAILGSVIHYLYNNSAPETIKDAFFPRTGKVRPDGSEDRLSMPTYMKDVYEYGHDIGGFLLYGGKPYSTLANKLHPLLGMISQMLSNEDFYGSSIRAPGDPVTQQLFDEAAYIAKQITPFGVRNYLQRSKTNEEQPNPLGYVTSASFFGFTPSPGYITKSDEERESAAISAQRSGLVSKFRQMVKDGDDPKDVAERARDSGMSPRDIQYILSANRPRRAAPRHLGQ